MNTHKSVKSTYVLLVICSYAFRVQGGEKIVGNFFSVSTSVHEDDDFRILVYPLYN